MKQPSSPSPELPLIPRDKRNAASGDDQGSGYNDATPFDHATENESLHALLKRICDHLDHRVHSEEEQRYEDDKENEMKKDWMLAAAVLDRICAITFAIIFVGGTLIFFINFYTHIV